MQGDRPPNGFAAAPDFYFKTRGRKPFFVPLGKGGMYMVLTYSEILATVTLAISLFRLVLDIIKYYDDTKKK